MQSIRYYHNEETKTSKVIECLEKIHRDKAARTGVYEEYFDPASVSSNFEDVFYIVGTGWYMCCGVDREVMNILDFVSDEVTDKTLQYTELTDVFKRLLITYKNYYFNVFRSKDPISHLFELFERDDVEVHYNRQGQDIGGLTLECGFELDDDFAWSYDDAEKPVIEDQKYSSLIDRICNKLVNKIYEQNGVSIYRYNDRNHIILNQIFRCLFARRRRRLPDDKFLCYYGSFEIDKYAKDDTFFVVGSGWAMIYEVDKEELDVSLFISDGKKSLCKSAEMLAFFKVLCSKYKDYLFSASCNENSIKFIEHANKRGLIDATYWENRFCSSYKDVAFFMRDEFFEDEKRFTIKPQ